MPTIQPSLFKAIGRGFLSDAYAANGNHLRWMFDPRLGFPRFAFCVEGRPSVTTPEGQHFAQHFADLRLPGGAAPQVVASANRPDIQAIRPGGSITLDPSGVVLTGTPLELTFLGVDPYACWVQLTLVVADPSGHAQTDAEYLNRGEYEPVDRCSVGIKGLVAGLLSPRALPRHLEQLARLLAAPEPARARRALVDPDLRKLHARLIAADPTRFSRVSHEWLRRIADALRELGARPRDLGIDLSVNRAAEIELISERIDRISITGSAAHLASIRWIRSEDLMAQGGWEPVGCFPAATSEKDYFVRNKPEYGGLSPEELAVNRVFEPPTQGAEPLDEPLVPPSRPPTSAELDARYLTPWRKQIEPWLVHVLTESLGGMLHQSEVSISADLVDAGQQRGHGLPTELAGKQHTLEIQPYDALLATAATFPMARLLGLGCVLPKVNEIPLDYRVRGRWLVEDLQAWASAMERRIEVALNHVIKASPFGLTAAQSEFAAALSEAAETAAFLSPLIAGASDGVVELWALTLNIAPAKRSLFAPPPSIDVQVDGLGLPPAHARAAVTAVSWPLRQRARVIIDEDIPLGACIGRGKAGEIGEFAEVRNPTDPATDHPVPIAVLPAGPTGAPGTAGTAKYLDRYAEDGVNYRYGVSEMDPFNRWSSFAETTFRWDDVTPPPPPVQVEAYLDQAGSPAALRLTIRFAWPLDLIDLTGFAFELHLRRTAPPSANALIRPNWGHFERLAGDGAGPFGFAAATIGATSHDGMAVTIAHGDETRPDAGGGPDQHYRIFSLTFMGLVVTRDTTDRAEVWVAVGSRNNKGIVSTELGGPGRGEHYLTVPPPPPVFPPEPLLATYPDADNRSSFTLTWPADSTRRHVVYRAGEKELVAMAGQRGIPTTWAEDDAPAVRSAAVRAVAPQLRDAFLAVSELLPAGAGAFTDELGGSLNTLTIYTVLAHSPSLIPAGWPGTSDAFVAVAVPHIPEPSMPVIVRAAWNDALGAIELQIAEPSPAGGPVAAFEIYRAIDPMRARDWRFMRPVGRLDLTVASFVSRPDGPPRVAIVVDALAKAWTTYFYRVVARAPGIGEAALGTRSEPSALACAVSLSTVPPTPPTGLTATRAAANLIVGWTAEAPPTQVAPFRFEVIRTAPVPRTLITGATADAARNTADPTLFSVTITEPPELDQATEVAITLIDPLGRRVETLPIAVS